MNKIKQNKITFRLILAAIAIFFSSITILSLPVLFKYKSKVPIVEKNFYKNFKIYLNSNGKISYKPFPKPHLLVENASLNLSKSLDNSDFIKTSNLKIFISLRDLYLRSFDNFVSVEISDTNLDFKISEIKEIRKHLYKKINKPIQFNNCIVFIRNKSDDVILISPIKKIMYKINKKNKIKTLLINGKVFGLDYKSNWKRSYMTPDLSFHDINLFNPNIEIKNFLKFENNNKFSGKSQISYAQDKLEYNILFDNDKIIVSSPSNEKINFNMNSKMQLKPFYFEGELTIKNKKVEKIIDNILLKLLLYDESYLGNFEGLFKIKFDDLNNKLIKSGEIDFIVNEKKIIVNEAKFKLDKIGYIHTNMSFFEDKGDIKFKSKNILHIENHIEFAKSFQVGSKKIKNVKQVNFDLIKNYGQRDFLIKNIKINNKENQDKANKIFIVKNIQNLRSHIREIID